MGKITVGRITTSVASVCGRCRWVQVALLDMKWLHELLVVVVVWTDVGRGGVIVRLVVVEAGLLVLQPLRTANSLTCNRAHRFCCRDTT